MNLYTPWSSTVLSKSLIPYDDEVACRIFVESSLVFNLFDLTVTFVKDEI